MAAKYSVVQYVPDFVRGERINIGVITYSEATNEVRVHVIENWHRVRMFGDGATGLQKLMNLLKAMSIADIKEAIEGWQQSVRFTKPSASLLDIDTLLVSTAERYLIDPERKEKAYRNKQDAVKLARREVEKAVKQIVGKAGTTFLKTSYSLNGKYARHEFDFALANGQPIVTADAISFEVPITKDLEKNLKVTEWAVRDVKDEKPDLPVAVVLLPPFRGNSVGEDFYGRAVGSLSRLGAETVSTDELPRWSEQQALRVAGHVAKSAGPQKHG